jgi:hypothetical protein
MNDFEMDLVTIRKLREVYPNKVRLIVNIKRTNYEDRTDYRSTP